MPAGTRDWRVEKTRCGELTAYLDGRALHSKFDPLREAEKAAAIIPSGTGIAVLAGLGLGYTAEAILKRAPGITLIIAEADEEALERVLSVRDISPLLRKSNVSLLTGGSPERIQSLLAGGAVGARLYYLPWKASVQANPQWYSRLEKIVHETARRREVNASTLKRFGSLWVRNLATNRAVLPKAISIDAVDSLFKDIPALILAGGPSLEDVLPHLQELSRRCLIIAVDTALRAIVRAGVVPDIIAAVDPQYWNTRHLDWCGAGTGHTLILAETATHPAVFRRLQGRCIMTRTRFPLGVLFEDAAGLRGELRAGGSVATAAWELAYRLGCRPLMAAGLDLGFPCRLTHYRGSLQSERPHYYSRRSSPAETAFFHALHDTPLNTVEDMTGHPLLTNRRMDIYHAWFTESVQSLAGKKPSILNPQSRCIEGMALIALGDLLSLGICRPQINKIISELNSFPYPPESESNLGKVSIELTRALLRLQSLAERGHKAAVSAAEKVRRRENPTKQIAAMETVDSEILNGSGLEVISFLMQPLILEITSAVDTPGDPLETSKKLYLEILESVNYHLEYVRVKGLFERPT